MPIRQTSALRPLLQELDLRSDAISEVPAAIGNLTALTRCGSALLATCTGALLPHTACG